jgi:methionine synthase II (cobalamin-independent)
MIQIVIIMLVTSIGSLPFTDVDRAVDAVLTYCPDIPFWPQLPRRSFHEDFYAQFLENIPGVVIDADGGNVYFDSRRITDLERFYEDVQRGDTSAFEMSERAAPGLYRLLERLSGGPAPSAVKVQLTGPFTMGIGLKDENGRSVIYDPTYFDIIKKGLHMKGRWMAETVKRSFPDIPLILFFDEPAMVSFGSAFVSVPREGVISSINEVIEDLPATTGVHCCGNTDWSVLLNTNVGMINYDAFAFLDTLFYFSKDLSAFLTRGGRVAPGIAPSTQEAITNTRLADVKAKWDRFVRMFTEAAGKEDQRDWIITTACGLVTTACGLGTVDEAQAIKALEFLSRLPAYL